MKQRRKSPQNDNYARNDNRSNCKLQLQYPNNIKYLSRIRCVVAKYLASQARDPRIDSHQH